LRERNYNAIGFYMDITKRSFLFGAAAVIAAVNLPLSVAEPANIFKAPALQPFKRRMICNLMATFDAETDGVASIELYVRDRLWFFYQMNQRSTFRWAAPPGGEIVLLPQDSFRLDVSSESGIGRIQLICYDYVDFADAPMLVSEEHTFPASGPALILPFHPDNSLEARRKRYLEPPAAPDYADYGDLGDES
jgi:hypothetical protein